MTDATTEPVVEEVPEDAERVDLTTDAGQTAVNELLGQATLLENQGMALQERGTWMITQSFQLNNLLIAVLGGVYELYKKPASHDDETSQFFYKAVGVEGADDDS